MSDPEQLMWFFRALGTMLESGVPILRAMETFEVQGPYLRDISLTITKELEGGKPLSHGMRLCALSPYQRGVVELGERTGGVGAALQGLAEAEERKLGLRRKLKQSLLMPGILLILAALLTFVFLPFCIFPAYLQLLSTLQVPEDGLFGVMVGFMRATQRAEFRVFLVVAGVLIVAMFFTAKQRDRFGNSLLSVLSSLPYWGPVCRQARGWQGLSGVLEAMALSTALGAKWGKFLRLARSSDFASALGIQLEVGAKLQEALRGAAAASGSMLLEMHVREMEEAVREGKPLHEALGGCFLTPFFPAIFIQMVFVAEESGGLAQSCRKCGELLAADTEHAIEGLLPLLEPLAIGFLGACIGLLCLFMMYPLFVVVQHL